MLSKLKDFYQRQVWPKLRLIGLINTTIILGLFYYLVFGAVAIARKIVLGIGDVKWQKGSYWVSRKQGPEENLLDQY